LVYFLLILGKKTSYPLLILYKYSICSYKRAAPSRELKDGDMAPKGPYKLCTVNKVPERAKRVIGRVVEDVKEEYTIVYVENVES
jgi:hypothetical protein